ncbi:hypothetical protein DCAR_0933622 [Daucus carota subsp. sativus]|uniref:Uncharacterized protein n=1 Tax=Daucus carota subsp. sativus TaxID=79200 RepID=A0AAF1BGI1_DAUCS|nr:hypothetical protein DCAR_0933622 [Daucus carota subsp. sativus]
MDRSDTSGFVSGGSLLRYLKALFILIYTSY